MDKMQHDAGLDGEILHNLASPSKYQRSPVKGGKPSSSLVSDFDPGDRPITLMSYSIRHMNDDLIAQFRKQELLIKKLRSASENKYANKNIQEEIKKLGTILRQVQMLYNKVVSEGPQVVDLPQNTTNTKVEIKAMASVIFRLSTVGH